MAKDLREVLREAAEAGEILPVIYHGGSQPGAVREISPLSVTTRKVRARDLATGVAKTFLLSKLEVADAGAQAPEYEPPVEAPTVDASTLFEALRGRVDEWRTRGWHVELSEEAVSLHRWRKDGRGPLKAPAIGLSYLPTQKYGLGDRRPSARPWRLDRGGQSHARTFGSLSTAVVAFLQEVEALSPDRTD